MEAGRIRSLGVPIVRRIALAYYFDDQVRAIPVILYSRAMTGTHIEKIGFPKLPRLQTHRQWSKEHDAARIVSIDERFQQPIKKCHDHLMNVRRHGQKFHAAV